MADFNLLIKEWYRQNRRDLPWRETKDPYFIWLSEIILQQTRVNQGLAYYLKFVKLFPDVHYLAKASEQDVLNAWQGLGYYSRARNLHSTAKFISENLKGDFPNNYGEIIKLKGIGEYTAAAIASFAFNEAVAVVDGNVYRVLSRLFDIDLAINSTKGKKYFFELAQSLINENEPDVFNQGIMEFGALHCTPLKPKCESCPLQVNCLSFANNTISERPQKEKKTKVRDRYFHYLIFNENENTLIEKRTAKDIWQNLYQFPLIESIEETFPQEIKNVTSEAPGKISKNILHVLSHQRIHAKFYHFNHFPNKVAENWNEIKLKNIQDYPLPRIIDRYLEE